LSINSIQFGILGDIPLPQIGGIMAAEDVNHSISRRRFLKVSGAVGAALGAGGMGLFGYQAGRDPSTYTGWETFEGADQSFDRKKYEVDSPTYQKVGKANRIDARNEVVFSRMSYLFRNYNDEQGVEGLPDHLHHAGCGDGRVSRHRASLVPLFVSHSGCRPLSRRSPFDFFQTKWYHLTLLQPREANSS
jgi:hypothetical protein